MAELKDRINAEKPNHGGPDEVQQRINQVLIKRLDDIDKRNDEMSRQTATAQTGFQEFLKHMEAKADKRAKDQDDSNLKLSASMEAFGTRIQAIEANNTKTTNAQAKTDTEPLNKQENVEA